MLGKRSYRNYSYGPNGRTYKRRGINLTRPPTYRRNQAWQDWRVMKYIARKPLNLRTGGFLGKEVKFVDYGRNGSVTNGTFSLVDPTTSCLNAVAQGSGESERIGRKITSRSLHIRGSLALGSPTAQSQRVRVIVFKDCQTNGATTVGTSVIDGAVGVSPVINSFRNLENLSRFTILKDKTFILRPDIAFDGTAIVGNAPDLSFIWNFNLTGEVSFDGPTADISDITDNAYHIMAASEAGGVSLIYTSRFRYLG